MKRFRRPQRVPGGAQAPGVDPRKMSVHRLVFAWVLSCHLGMASVVAHGWGFDELMESLSERPRFSADFIESRSSFFLARPMELSGRILFVADERLEKIIEKPFSEHVIINRDEIVIHRTNEQGKAETHQTTRYRLERHPVLARAVQGVSDVFAGDKTLLEDMYHTRLEGDRETWQLELEPRHDKLKEFISLITLRGSGGVISFIHTLEADGDESSLVLTQHAQP